MSAFVKRVVPGVLVLSVVLSMSPARATPYRIASELFRQQGVAAYSLELKGQQIEVRLLAVDKSVVGDLAIKVAENRVRALTLVRGPRSLSLQWSPSSGELKVKDWNGEEGSIKIQDARVIPNSTAGLILRRSQQDLRFLAGFLGEFRNEIEAIDRDLGYGPEIDLPGDLQSEIQSLVAASGRRSTSSLSKRKLEAVFQAELGPQCTGSKNRGTGFSDTRSSCCEEAYSEVQGACWNSQCVGCCETLACDAACVFGDYICGCGMSGYECGLQ